MEGKILGSKLKEIFISRLVQTNIDKMKAKSRRMTIS